MEIKYMSVSELVALRGWIMDIYNSGKISIDVNTEQVNKLNFKLKEIDEELLDRVIRTESFLVDKSIKLDLD